jgi:hypothetical protein
MPTEPPTQLLVAGPVRPEDPEAQAADDFVPLVRALARMVRRRLAAEQPPTEEDPPPEDENGLAARPEAASPKASRITTVTAGHQTDKQGVPLCTS